MTVLLNTRNDFTLGNFRRVSYGGEPVRVGAQARRVMTAGAGHGPAVGPPGGESAGRAPRAAPGAGFGGGFLDPAVVRGILFARLASLVSGHAGVRPSVADRVAALLDGPMPQVPLDGQAGTGEVLPMACVLAGLRRDDLDKGEEEALLGGAPCSAALAADAAIRARYRLAHAEGICALSIEAFRAPLGAYDEALDDLWGDPHETAALRGLRRYLHGAGTAERRSHQAPVSYRIIPRVLGQVHRAVAAIEKAATVSLRSVTSDVVYVADEAGRRAGRAVRSGGYHNGMAYPALNALSAAWADLALVAERQVTALNTAETSGLPVNLVAPGAPGNGTYAYGWAANGYVEEARAAATPALLPAVAEDPHADVLSPTFSAYRRECRAAECLDGVLAILAVVSSQALFVTGRNPPQPLRPVLFFVRSVFPPIDGTGERDLSADGGRLQQALGAAARSGELAVPDADHGSAAVLPGDS
ncbi:MAG TPA: aromatic amino acid lyase [Streptosporangiaceae bacterium]|jgi:histidine ammonia-lyase